eukprot:CAMPEP_0116842550 /NCGR_PEP_ID=MMETSP0418-20121206/11581_1 /TAXON_ID=1158023 /ORGANISM="Astrosyne radiata, Strain 13vi08-1A" /LENGTH=107 /DNA_ID=CAMNT_0004473177 /DNA_START=236 /DNA_END=559 /DNA_ORIENTATION=-
MSSFLQKIPLPLFGSAAGLIQWGQSLPPVVRYTSLPLMLGWAWYVSPARPYRLDKAEMMALTQEWDTFAHKAAIPGEEDDDDEDEDEDEDEDDDENEEGGEDEDEEE